MVWSLVYGQLFHRLTDRQTDRQTDRGENITSSYCVFRMFLSSFSINFRTIVTETWREHTLLTSTERLTDLKNRTGSSIYCWETETNGGHIGVTT